MRKFASILFVLALAGLLCIGCGPTANTTADNSTKTDSQDKTTAEDIPTGISDGSKAKADSGDSSKAKAADTEKEEGGVPDTFNIKFECSNGTFIVRCDKKLAPIGVEHLYELVKSGFYNETRFFRVVPDFVVQFGMSGDPAVQREWEKSTLKDDPVRFSNKRGALTYAMRGPNTRTTQLFINLKDNPGLDGQGFSPLGTVISGMDVVDGITSQYGQAPDQMKIKTEGNKYLEREFPNLDYVIKATIVEE